MILRSKISIIRNFIKIGIDYTITSDIIDKIVFNY